MANSSNSSQKRFSRLWSFGAAPSAWVPELESELHQTSPYSMWFQVGELFFFCFDGSSAASMNFCMISFEFMVCLDVHHACSMYTPKNSLLVLREC